MKKVFAGLVLTYSVIFAAQSMSTEDKGCVENLENEIVKIINSDIENDKKQEAIEVLKIRVKNDNHATCESEYQEEIKKMVFGNKKIAPTDVIKKHAKQIKENSKYTNASTEDCIESFEQEILNIINANPNDLNKEKTQLIMHEIVHDQIVESCESEFEQETKKIVNSKQK